MGTDLKDAEIEKIMTIYDKDNTNTLNFEQFSLAIFNRKLFDSYNKMKGIETFLNM
jgi:hypothetical protein